MMKKRLIKNDCLNHPFVSVLTCLFMAVSAMLIGLTVLLFSGLMHSMDHMMETAMTPSYLQMHAGEVEETAVKSFADSRDEVVRHQICGFLNIESGSPESECGGRRHGGISGDQ